MQKFGSNIKQAIFWTTPHQDSPNQMSCNKSSTVIKQWFEEIPIILEPNVKSMNKLAHYV